MEEAFSPAAIAARVAERYARVPSYQEVLAAQAAAAKASARFEPPGASPAITDLPASQEVLPPSESETAPADEPLESRHEPLRYSVSSDSLPTLRSTPAEARAEALASPRIPSIARSPTDPLQEAMVEPAQPLPASLIAHPRELVAPLKARPRLAEGPLHDEAKAAGSNRPVATAELRLPVAEREAGKIPQPSAATPPEWRSIHLDTEVSARMPGSTTLRLDGPRLDVASLEDRAIAALTDGALTISAFLLFMLVFVVSTTNLPHGRVALVGAGVTLFATWLLYQFLFFGLTDATPGMRFAKIALCTFDDENPSCSVLRGRIAALVLSALPLGLGFIWAAFDEDSLGWHDRITQTYQRSYRGL